MYAHEAISTRCMVIRHLSTKYMSMRHLSVKCLSDGVSVDEVPVHEMPVHEVLCPRSTCQPENSYTRTVQLGSLAEAPPTSVYIGCLSSIDSIDTRVSSIHFYV
jgi:hypothetical protein